MRKSRQMKQHYLTKDPIAVLPEKKQPAKCIKCMGSKREFYRDDESQAPKWRGCTKCNATGTVLI